MSAINFMAAFNIYHSAHPPYPLPAGKGELGEIGVCERIALAYPNFTISSLWLGRQ